MQQDPPGGAAMSDMRALDHESLLEQLADAPSDDARHAARDELSRRLAHVPPPRAPAARPWDPENGGC